MQQCLRSWAPPYGTRCRLLAPPGSSRTAIRRSSHDLRAIRPYSDAFEEAGSKRRIPRATIDPPRHTEKILIKRLQVYKDRRELRDTSGRQPAPVDDPWLETSAPGAAILQDGRDASGSQVENSWTGEQGDQLKSIESGEDPASLQLDPRATGWADALLPSVPYETMWTQSVLALMARDPSRVIDLLLVTHRAPYPPVGYISSIIRYLFRYFRQQSPDVGRRECTRIVEALEVLANRDERLNLHSVVGDAMHFLDIERVRPFFDTIMTHNILVGPHDYVRLCKWLVSAGELERATDAYLMAHQAGGGTRRAVDHDLSACVALLRGLVSDPDRLADSLRLAAELEGMGIRLNAQTANVLLLSAVDLGEIDTAMELYATFFRGTVLPDEVTVSILLKAFQKNSSKSIPLEDILATARKSGVYSSSSMFATNLLNFLLRACRSDTDAWFKSWRAYSELFNTAPLIQLGIPPPVEFERTPSDSSKSAPAQAIAIMLNQYLDLQRSDPRAGSHTVQIWKQFQALVATGEKLFVTFAATDHFYNIFMVHLVRTQRMLLSATEVIKDMQTPLPESFGVKKCAPTDKSWSIFRDGFANHGLASLADQVSRYMQSEGVRYAVPEDDAIKSTEMDESLNDLRSADQSGAAWESWAEQSSAESVPDEAMEDKPGSVKQKEAEPVDYTADLREGLVVKMEKLDTQSE